MCSYQPFCHLRCGSMYKDARKLLHDITSMVSCTEHQSKDQQECSCRPLRLMSMKGPCPKCYVFEESICFVRLTGLLCLRHRGLRSSSLVLLAGLCMYHILFFFHRVAEKMQACLCTALIQTCGLSVQAASATCSMCVYLRQLIFAQLFGSA